ncbi:molybdopterin cofactor-binding domain-containing protein [Noviherbaspirillum sp. 1P10PC]|uniref:xanthine dehydrogenase family protein molybdopterin-binding subunit n=1 Tax=Noviherbaspirillum sp. 1P10PC TaxID=3132292 RepID=UPI0039A0C360
MNMAYVSATEGQSLGPPLPGSMQRNRRLCQWLRFSAQGYVDVLSGKVELGQGILTALAQIVAEELDLRLDQVRMIPASTATSPDEAVTSGSLSVQESGAALRCAGAEARHLFIEAAAALFACAPADLRTVDGDIIHADGRRSSYWALAETVDLDREASGLVVPRDASAYRLVGQAAARLDLPAKVFGLPHFIHDIALPGMRHGRMLRPPGPAARLVSGDAAAAALESREAQLVCDGSLVAVVAASQHLAERAAALAAPLLAWQLSPAAAPLPDRHDLAGWIRRQPAQSAPIAASEGGPAAAPAAATLSASYGKPYIAHASIAPSCALALWDGARLTVWTHSQGIYNLRKDLALAFALRPDDITVQHAQGAGCYGHNGADDVAYDAAWLARAMPGVPVRVQWSRADELAWSPFGPAMLVDLEADVDASGAVLDWRHSVRGNGHSNRPGRAATPALLGSFHAAEAFPPLLAVNAPLAAGGGAERNAQPCYDFPSWRATGHRLLTMPLRTSALRALGALANVFAIESFMDELALAAGRDALEYRLAHCGDPRARAVLQDAARRAGWPGTQLPPERGLGIGFARYKNTGAWCAVVAEIEAGQEIRAVRLTISVDVGTVINPDGVINQIEGGAIQACSWALKEEVAFDDERVTSDSWETYPILRFSEVPAVDVAIMPSNAPSLGAGEAALGPTAAALANAVARALGVRVRELPLTAQRITRLLL